tara:strand:- start:5077 stop:5811 length:735 start_codon:yes stop_codon:yes gene_type:complete
MDKLFTFSFILFFCGLINVHAQHGLERFTSSSDLAIQNAEVRYMPDLEILVFEIEVTGQAGETIPEAAGQLDGAPVLGYVFPTTLSPGAVGFNNVEGIVALALTSHPDFDDTPLWDERGDGNYDNDGVIWHPHWVVLNSDDRVDGGLSVLEFDEGDESVVLPPTNPGMPMYMDSPGFQVVTRDNRIFAVVPKYRVRGNVDFSFDAVSAFMRVNTSDESRPMLGVYNVYSVLSGDLSLPYTVTKE